MNKTRDIKAIDSIVMELRSTYLKNNKKYFNLVDAIVTLIKEKRLMCDKLSILMNYDLLVLSDYATTLCEEGFSKFVEIEMFIMLLDPCDEVRHV